MPTPTARCHSVGPVTSEPGTAGPSRPRVVIAEDSVLLLAGLTKLLESAGFEVAATAGEASGLLAAVEREQPDVVIADVRMPPSHTDEGLRAAIAIRRDHPGVGILVFSQYIETRYAAELLAGGAAGIGYLLKDRVADVAEFTDAITRIAAGGTALDPEVVSGLLNASRHASALGTLTALSVITRAEPISALERPSAIMASTSRSRCVKASRGSPPRRTSSWATTSGSSAVPPAATRRSASRNSATSATRSFSR